MLRALGVLCVIGAAVTAYFEYSWHGAVTFKPAGKWWYDVDPESLQLAQPAVERYVDPALWTLIIQPVLEQPLVFVCFGFALVFFLLSWVIRNIFA